MAGHGDVIDFLSLGGHLYRRETGEQGENGGKWRLAWEK
jgi:hypothetical protein